VTVVQREFSSGKKMIVYFFLFYFECAEEKTMSATATPIAVDNTLSADIPVAPTTIESSPAPPADSLYYQNPKFRADQPYTFQPSHYLVKPKVGNARGGRKNQLPPQHPVSSLAQAMGETSSTPLTDDTIMAEAIEEVNSAEIIGPDSIRAKEEMIKTVLSILARSPPSSMLKADIYSGAGGIAFLFHKLYLLDPMLSFSLDLSSPKLTCIEIAKLYIDKSISLIDTPSFISPRSYQCGFTKSKSGVYALAAVGKFYS
jgi:hypothetical protein